ncbi:ammonium transporter [Paramicrobacterium humi]|uniref:Ammonium transporter n=1 Tax=Paramicrobacterium humi TaxID=640635 RepID=A0A1H4QNF2_9MICO|nr:ammonium transporter [Microbacterium humi]SEC21102.1 ammonium transporter [Microbacterium humi]
MDTGSIAWGVVATALVLLMTPGVAFFYGGLVKAKSVVSMMMMSFGALALIGVLWVLYGANMSTVGSVWDFAGNPFSDFGLGAMAAGDTANTDLLGVAFSATFAIITVALISGAIADRARFGSWMLFAGAWATLVYFPVAAWVWGGGWILHLGTTLFGAETTTAVIDYAGGTAVHINAGAAALALTLVLGKRTGFGKGFDKPHNVPLVLLGAALLWFGWFGFNAGAEWLNELAGSGLIVLNTLGATAAAIIGWLVVEKIKDGKPTSVGAASGAVSGLVAITPACANLTPGWSLLLGVVTGAVCALAVELKYRLGYDDALDVVGIHLVGGLIGTLYLGFFATGTGLFTGGGVQQLVLQLIAALAVLVYSFVVAWVLGFAIEKTIGFRLTEKDEAAGVDSSVHGESAYAMEIDARV